MQKYFPMGRIQVATSLSGSASSEVCSFTVADLIATLRVDPGLSAIRKRDLCSALKRVCEIGNRDPERVPADVRSIRNAIRSVHPEQIGLSSSTWSNIKSNALAALRHGRGNARSTTSQLCLSAEWQALVDQMPDKRLRNGLSRFIKFCSDRGITPDQVDDAVIESFMDWVRNDTFVNEPNDCHRRTCRLWNEAAAALDAWPNTRLSVPSYREPRQSIPLSKFPPALRREVEALCDWLLGKDLFCEHPPPKVCKPRTVTQRVKMIELAVSAYVHRGNAIEDLQSLADLVAFDAVKDVLRFYLMRRNSKPSQFIRSLLKELIRIARYRVRVDPEHVEALKDLGRRLGTDTSGLTTKNRECLRQFDDDGNKWLLLNLPAKLAAEAASRPVDDTRAAVTMQIALAIEILLMAPMRSHNLIDLRLGRHVIRPGGPAGPVHLVVPGTETKAGEEVEYPLPAETQAVLDLYLRAYRPRLCRDDDPWLFPKTGGGRKAQATLSQQIKETILKKTGLVMTVHQFRHLAAKFLLEHQPGNFEGARQLLTHKNIKSTTNYYTGLQTPQAARHYDAFLQGERDRLRDTPARTSRHKRTKR